MPSLIIDVRPGERLTFADGDAELAAVELVHKSGQLVRLRVDAPRAVRIEKRERDADDVPRMAMSVISR
jgi:hypothetical protein